MTELLAQGGPPAHVDWWYASVMGLVEGLTEFLPVSSTGHLIVTSALFQRPDPAFEVGIQFGAITAILVLYGGRILGSLRTLLRRQPSGQVNLLFLIVAAAIAPAVIGLLCEDWIDSHLFNNYTVAVALVVGGVALIALEWWQRRAGKTEADLRPMEGMSLRQAFVIGLFQCLALVPGTSRSAATIAGALVLGFQRTVAAEFSFLVGLPLLYGACGVKLLGKPEVLAGGPRTVEFAVGSAVAFLSALLVVGPFVRFLRRHTFVPFGVYRIIAGALLLALVRAGVVSG